MVSFRRDHAGRVRRDGKLTERPTPLFFWEYNTARLAQSKPEPWIDPELQKGTTPLVKLMGGKATRDFTNYRRPAVADQLATRMREWQQSVLHSLTGADYSKRQVR